ncbi:hypothetical protein FA15DRAFT_661033, partial [Coprinopsis marcescibilis]
CFLGILTPVERLKATPIERCFLGILTPVERLSLAPSDSRFWVQPSTVTRRHLGPLAVRWGLAVWRSHFTPRPGDWLESPTEASPPPHSPHKCVWVHIIFVILAHNSTRARNEKGKTRIGGIATPFWCGD